MLGYILLGIYIFSCLLASAGGSTAEAGNALMAGAQSAVELCIGIAGSLCLWSAVMELMQESGLSDRLSALLRPVLVRLFPHSGKDPHIMAALSENVSANLLGLGNAATPAGIRAAKSMADRLDPTVSTNELSMLVVLNTASIQLLPTTIASVRAAAGAASAFDIIPAVLASSFLSVCAGLAAARLFMGLSK